MKRFKTHQSKGFTLIETLIVLIAVGVVSAGIYTVLHRTTERQTEEQRTASFTTEMRRVKSRITDDIKKMQHSLELTDFLPFLANDGATIPTTAVTAEPNNQFGESTVYPDSMTLVYGVSNKGAFQPDADVDPETTTVDITVADVQLLPTFAADDIVMINTRKHMLLRQVTKSEQLSPLTTRLYLKTYANSLLMLADGTPVTSYEVIDAGNTILNNPAGMSVLDRLKTTIRQVKVVKYHCSPSPAHGGDLMLFRQEDFATAATTRLFSRESLHDCQFSYTLDSNPGATIDQIDDLEYAATLSYVEFEFRKSTSDNKLSHHGRIAVNSVGNGSFNADMTQIDAVPTAPWSPGGSYYPGNSLVITNTPHGAITARTFSEVLSNNDLAFYMKIYKQDGTEIPVNVPSSNTPYTTLAMLENGQIIVGKAPVPDAAGEFEAQAVALSVDPTTGEIDLDTSYNFSFPELKGVGAVTSKIMNVGGTDYVAMAVVGPNNINETSGKAQIGLYYKVADDYAADFTKLAVWDMPVPVTDSQMAMGISLVEDVYTGLDALAVQFTPTTSQRGGIWVAALKQTNFMPPGCSTEAACTELPMRQLMEFEANSGWVGNLFGIKTSVGSPVQSFAIDLFLNTVMVNYNSFVEMIADALSGSYTPFLMTSAPSDPNGGYYCQNRLPKNVLSSTATGNQPNGDFVLTGPVVESSAGIQDEKTIVSTDLMTQGQSLIYNAPTNIAVQGMVSAYIRPDTTSKKAIMSMVHVIDNAENSTASVSQEATFFSYLPENYEGGGCSPDTPSPPDADPTIMNELAGPLGLVPELTGSKILAIDENLTYFIDNPGSRITLQQKISGGMIIGGGSPGGGVVSP